MGTPEGQETNTISSTKNLVLDKTPMNKTKLLVLVVLVVAAVLLVLANKNPSPKQGTEQNQNVKSQSQKPEIPKELILGKVIPSQPKLDFPDPDKVNFAQFTTTKPKDELVKFYTDQFSKNGWVIQLSKQSDELVYSIIAENKDQRLIVNVILNQLSNGGSTFVSITYRVL